ncbi:MAG: DALR domain-containing protein, partial [Gemmataceae bacterium]
VEFSKIWMHNGLLKIRSANDMGGSAKMAGSVGNVVNIADLLQRHSAETVRFLLLSTHYRSPIEYSEERLDEVKRSLQTFHQYFERFYRITGRSFFALHTSDYEDPTNDLLDPELLGLWRRFHEVMDDDFNTGAAVGLLFDLLRSLNRYIDSNKLDSEGAPGPEVEELVWRTRILQTFSNILGLFWQEPPKATLGSGDELVAGLMNLLIELRANLRTTAKNITDKTDPTKKALFDQTDLIRQRLAALNIALEDRATGTAWRVEK